MRKVPDISPRGVRFFPVRRTLWPLLALLLTLSFTGCQKDDVITTAAARNVFEGVADGTAFSNNGMVVLKDSIDNFLMVGNLPNSGSILAAFSGREEREYPIADDGALASLSDYLDQLIAVDSFFIDTVVLQQIFSDSAQLIPAGKSFLFITQGEETFFSSRGNLTLSTFDPTINRLYGTIEAEYSNALTGPKYINALFEDVYFFDCSSFEECAY